MSAWSWAAASCTTSGTTTGPAGLPRPPDRRGSSLLWQNVPFTWGNITTVDAYARWRFNQHASVELVGSNLGNRYYVDPATRSTLPAPGRTIKLGITARF